MAKGIHTEETFESHIEASLREHGGYVAAKPDAYDSDRALLPGTTLDFVRSTQPKTWNKLAAIHGDKLETLFLDALAHALGTTHGIMRKTVELKMPELALVAAQDEVTFPSQSVAVTSLA